MIKQQIIITDRIIIIEQIISEEYCHYRHVRFSSCNCISNNWQAAQFDSEESSQINSSILFFIFSRVESTLRNC